MKATFDIKDEVMERLQKEADLRGTTESQLVETGLLLLFSDPQILAAGKKVASNPKKPLPSIPTWKSGGHLVNIDDREELYRATDLERDLRLYGKEIV